MKRILPALFAAALPMLAPAAHAEGFGLGVRASTLGFGIEAQQHLSPSFDLRLGIDGIAYSTSYRYEDVHYDIDESLAVPAINLDWRPMQGVFRLTAGAAYYNGVSRLQAIPSACCTYQIGYGFYTSSQIGVLTGKASYHTASAYLGAGWDFFRRQGRGFGLSVDAGAYYRGRPDVWLSASGGGVTAADLNQEVTNIRDDTWRIYPMVAVGASYRF